MKVKTLVLMGGKGKRLYPLTEMRPKPNVYVGPDKRMGLYAISRVVNAGYFNMVLAVAYMADEIREKYGDGSHLRYDNAEARVKFTYSPVPGEDKSSATADALRKARIPLADGVVVHDRKEAEDVEISVDEYIEDRKKEDKRYAFKSVIENYSRILVVPGDGVHNLDLSKLMEFHRERGAFATIALYKMPSDRLGEIVKNLGMVDIDSHGRITKFIEKPSSIEMVSSPVVNTGIYVFEREFLDKLNEYDWMDFGIDVFPDLLKLRQEDFFGYLYDEPDDYWNDVGTLESYRQTCRRLRNLIPQIDVRSGKLIEGSYDNIIGMVGGNSLLGQGITVGLNSEITNSIVGNNVFVGSNVKLDDCILFPGTVIESDFNGQELILDTRVHIEPHATIEAKSVVGSGTRIKKGAQVGPEMLIPADQRITGKLSKQ